MEQQTQTSMMESLHNAKNAGRSVDDIHYEILVKMYQDGCRNAEIVEFFLAKGIKAIRGVNLVPSNISKLALQAGLRKNKAFSKRKSVEDQSAANNTKKVMFGKIVASACLTDEEVATLYGFLLGGA